MENEKLSKISQEMKQKQVACIKEIVKLTLDKIDKLEKTKIQLQRQIFALRHDLVDLKEGRLDRIIERQQIDKSVLEISILTIKKYPNNTKQQSSQDHWYEDYEITYRIGDELPITFKLNNSLSKMYASGSYKLNDETIKYL